MAKQPHDNLNTSKNFLDITAYQNDKQVGLQFSPSDGDSASVKKPSAQSSQKSGEDYLLTGHGKL